MTLTFCFFIFFLPSAVLYTPCISFALIQKLILWGLIRQAHKWALTRVASKWGVLDTPCISFSSTNVFFFASLLTEWPWPFAYNFSLFLQRVRHALHQLCINPKPDFVGLEKISSEMSSDKSGKQVGFTTRCQAPNTYQCTHFIFFLTNQPA